MQRKLLITGVGVKMKFESQIDPNTFERHNQQFKGVIQLDVVSSGDFSGLTEEALENLIINYFRTRNTIVVNDFIRSITN